MSFSNFQKAITDAFEHIFERLDNLEKRIQQLEDEREETSS
ncbi:MAG: hypothetical protein ACFE9L_14970 [Candidatus Hodarchaeota archaeon]